MKENSKFKQKRYCKVCKKSLRKYGKTASGSQRWQCIFCNKTTHISRQDSVKYKELKMFVCWLLDKKAASQNCSFSRMTFYRKTKWCWELKPRPILSSKCHKVVFVDAIYIKRNHVCIVLRNPTLTLTF
jgi:hypothetical protein